MNKLHIIEKWCVCNLTTKKKKHQKKQICHKQVRAHICIYQIFLASKRGYAKVELAMHFECTTSGFCKPVILAYSIIQTHFMWNDGHLKTWEIQPFLTIWKNFKRGLLWLAITSPKKTESGSSFSSLDGRLFDRIIPEDAPKYFIKISEKTVKRMRNL